MTKRNRKELKRQARDAYLEEYNQRKKKGTPFFPDIIFKDTVVMAVIFIVLLALATFATPGLEEFANPADTNYTPRPEWYFLFLFQLLKFFPGNVEFLGVVVLPALALTFLAILPWTDYSLKRHYTNRPVVTGVTLALIAGATFLTVQSIIEAPPPAPEVDGAESPVALGSELFAQNCSTCHGDLGEGGANPARPGDIIAPISTAEYLSTRDDTTLTSIISAGQPNFGMSPFGLSNGGPLNDQQIGALVVFLRSWEENPPVDLPPEIENVPAPTASGADVYGQSCAQCHGTDGEGGIGPAFTDADWQAAKTDDQIFTDIELGHPASPMIAWGEILSNTQIDEVVAHIRQLGGAAVREGPITYEADIAPIFQTSCAACHGQSGGWDAASYQTVMLSGANGPTIVPGDALNSSLAQSLLGTHPRGLLMPPTGKLPDSQIQLIVDWINTGAAEKAEQ